MAARLTAWVATQRLAAGFLCHASSSCTWAITRCAPICSHGPASEAAKWALVFGSAMRNNTYVLLFC
jgi:hypothetical protein